MLELVVLAEVVVAEGALEYPPAVLPHAALALDAHASLGGIQRSNFVKF